MVKLIPLKRFQSHHLGMETLLDYRISHEHFLSVLTIWVTQVILAFLCVAQAISESFWVIEEAVVVDFLLIFRRYYLASWLMAYKTPHPHQNHHSFILKIVHHILIFTPA